MVACTYAWFGALLVQRAFISLCIGDRQGWDGVVARLLIHIYHPLPFVHFEMKFDEVCRGNANLLVWHRGLRSVI